MGRMDRSMSALAILPEAKFHPGDIGVIDINVGP
jgi:hypothetical protein